jgi:uncharacterized membrane protein
MNKNRLENFSDGVFAIAVTLLVLNIKLPDVHSFGDTGLNGALLTMVPHVLTYIFTFLVVGVFWVGHHRIFTFVRILDTGMLWLNIIYLLFVAILPFPAAILSENPFQPTAIILYCVSLTLIASMHFLFMAYIMRHKEMKDDILTAEVYRSGIRNAVLGPLIYLAAAAMSFVSVYISFVLIVLALVFYIFFAGRKLENKLIKESLDKERK